MNRIILFLVVSLFVETAYAQLYVNEVMAKNESVLADEAGEFDDWIEIYNAGSENINLAGYYLTDNFADPASHWEIPNTDANLTTVPAGGFLILWADKDVDQGANHLDFKLSGSGELIVLVAKDGETVVNSVEFGEQSTDASFGRQPDGSDDFVFFLVSTPGFSNANQDLPTTYTGLVKKQISATEDDAEQWPGGDMEMVSYGMDIVGQRILGLRFPKISIPQGATITDAWIQFVGKDPQTEAANFSIHMQDADDAAPFQDEFKNITNRPLTDAYIGWQPASWVINKIAGPDQRTPNLSSLVQEVVNRPGWQPSNDVVFIFSGTGIRQSYSFDGIPELAPRLFISFEANASTIPVSNIFINELAPNASTYQDEMGDTEDWIELYNGGNSAVNIGGLFLSDNKDNLLKWAIADPATIAPGGFRIVWADKETDKGGLHASFNLSSGGETVFLTQVINNEVVMLDSITYPAVLPFASYGRVTDGQNAWKFFGGITPDASNNGAVSFLAAPTVSPDQGLYTGNISVTIQHPEPGAMIRYTTNGNEPTSSDPVYGGPINVSNNTVVRAKAFKDGFFPSRTAMSGYIFNSNHDLPVLHVTTDPKNLWDDEIGIYVTGTNGIEGNFCADPNLISNYYQDWERPAEITMYEPDGNLAFSVNAGIKISGKCSRKYPMKSLNVFMRGNQYGDKTIDYPIFSDRDSKKYKRLRIRNGGNDFDQGKMLQDATIHAILKEQLDYQSSQPVATYINGEYWGIMNLREKYGFDYFKRHYGVDKDEFDFIKDPGLKNTLKRGDMTAFYNMYQFAKTKDLSDAANYASMQTMMNEDNFLNYWISMIYIASVDWPGNNKQAFRSHKNGRFEWQVLDTDITAGIFGSSSRTTASYNTLLYATDPTSEENSNHKRSSMLFRKMLENEVFEGEFIQRSMSFMQLVFNKDRTDFVIDSMASRIDSEIGDHIERWDDYYPQWISYSNWLDGVDSFKDFFVERPAYWEGFVKDYFALGETYDLTLNFNASTKGDVVLHTSEMTIPFNYKGQYFKNVPIRVTAIADEGYEFVKWEETGNTNATILYTGTDDFTLTPIFKVETVGFDDVIGLSGINIFPNPSSGHFTIDWKTKRSDIGIFSVYNLLGQTIWQKEISFTKEHADVVLPESIGQGIYFLEIASDAGQIVKKLMVY